MSITIVFKCCTECQWYAMLCTKFRNDWTTETDVVEWTRFEIKMVFGQITQAAPRAWVLWGTFLILANVLIKQIMRQIVGRQTYKTFVFMAKSLFRVHWLYCNYYIVCTKYLMVKVTRCKMSHVKSALNFWIKSELLLTKIDWTRIYFYSWSVVERLNTSTNYEYADRNQNILRHHIYQLQRRNWFVTQTKIITHPCSAVYI